MFELAVYLLSNKKMLIDYNIAINGGNNVSISGPFDSWSLFWPLFYICINISTGISIDYEQKEQILRFN